MEFKIGDKVRIKDNLKSIEDFKGRYVEELEGHVGEICTIERLEYGRAYLKENNWTWDIRALEKVFTKSDLKDGDIVTYRNGNVRTIKKNKLLDEDNFEINTLNSFKETLKCKSTKDYDIIKVERPLGYKTLFERKEEILDKAEKRYLKDVIRPWRDKVKTITKFQNGFQLQWITIYMKSNDMDISLPSFNAGAMYRGMKLDRDYTLEELRIIRRDNK